MAADVYVVSTSWRKRLIDTAFAIHDDKMVASGIATDDDTSAVASKTIQHLKTQHDQHKRDMGEMMRTRASTRSRARRSCGSSRARAARCTRP